jgi:uncharacterized LabA/DUF88 family protein
LQESRPQEVRKARCTIYIDGFNWYFGIFRHKPEWKWLNIQSFFEELRKDDDVLKIRLFTAMVGDDRVFHEARDRQKRFLKAISCLSKVEVVYGYFQLREKTCLASCGKVYAEPEEKKTDVNIAVSMIGDAIDGKTDSIVLVSGDSDLQPAIEWIAKRFQKIKITVYVPSLMLEASERRSDFYRRIGVACKFLPIDHLKDHQLPNKMLLSGGGSVERPSSWK